MTERRRRARTVLLIVAAAACAAVAVFVAWVVTGTPDTLNRADADHLQATLTSASLDTAVTALDPDLREPVFAAGRPLLPAGSVLRIDPATFRVLEPGIAQVDATLDGGPMLLMLAEQPDRRWLVYASGAPA